MSHRARFRLSIPADVAQASSIAAAEMSSAAEAENLTLDGAASIMHFIAGTVTAMVRNYSTINKMKFPSTFLKNREKGNAFMNELNGLVDRAEFATIATVIDEQRYVKEDASPANPYDSALRSCMEQAYAFLQDRQQHKKTAHIVVERRGKREGHELGIAFQKICDDAGCRSVTPSFEIVSADKRSNPAGLQRADLTARPTGRHIVRKGAH